MRTAQLHRFQDVLLEMRQRLREDMDRRIETVPEVLRASGEVTNLPTHLADEDVEGLMEAIAIGQVQEDLINDVEAALSRIDAGKYGFCEGCGGAISQQRLKALPHARYCVECERRVEAERE